MPEGDTVWRTAALLRGALEGRELIESDVRVPRYATVDLTGVRIDDVVSRGKHLLIRGGGRTVHTHLKMEGAWHVYPSGGRWARPAHEARIVLATTDHEAVGFALGITEILPTDREAEVVGHLGPDLLGPDWDAERAAANLAADGDRPIGEALVDQRNLAGIGNVYRNELCFLRGVDPVTPVSKVDSAAMVRLAHRMMHADKNNPIRRRPWVYGRSGRRCRRCGAALVTRTMAGQRIVHCPSCQPPG
ncbi:Fpg/Nei family DNA glycosylase [Rhodococcus rhodnii]|uniref:DNA-(apurinic or apyrimidinic site) lyase n=2 Tax=Rhodococcus rhodnii TaxID=38312 RepID=R7WJF2_9NOCA|nr:DNA-formamidopyrimidine glycosylase family protein [Rhodococcus rhodnii]EOM75421.1 DNA-formamidopyrimidine glycosylase [Rhodococcus rhodnii LMG 5362]TXG90546.1 Fpg/Nei family DNA glycosylase [Rhodococcus rhodnii]